MKKEKTLETNDLSTGAGKASRLPYTAPELFIYNHAKITMGGVNIGDANVDFIGGGTTSYKLWS